MGLNFQAFSVWSNILKATLLARIGGNNVAKTVNNIMKFAVHHTFALKLRITNASGKLAFGGSLTAKLVRGKEMIRFAKVKFAKNDYFILFLKNLFVDFTLPKIQTRQLKFKQLIIILTR